MTLCVFDVNETLLDLSALDDEFEQLFGDRGVRVTWFGQMLQSALVATVTERYLPFGTVGVAALQMVAERRGVTLGEERERRLLDGMRTLPPHPETAESLAMLRAAGFRVAALTNSTLEVARAQIGNAGLSDLLEEVLSADEVQRLKPAPEPYALAADRLGVGLADIRLIAAHSWDVTGAIRAGARAAFVARPGMVLDPSGETPDIIGADLGEVAEAIIATDRP
jgi:2-haloacid dehalogenase